MENSYKPFHNLKSLYSYWWKRPYKGFDRRVDLWAAKGGERFEIRKEIGENAQKCEI
jgi:hypothetical protein